MSAVLFAFANTACSALLKVFFTPESFETSNSQSMLMVAAAPGYWQHMFC